MSVESRSRASDLGLSGSLVMGGVILISIVMATITIAMTVSIRNATEALKQSDAIEELLLRQEEEEASRAARLAEAVTAVDRLAVERQEELLARIEDLLARPQGTQPDPVTAVPPGGDPE